MAGKLHIDLMAQPTTYSLLNIQMDSPHILFWRQDGMANNKMSQDGVVSLLAGYEDTLSDHALENLKHSYAFTSETAFLVMPDHLMITHIFQDTPEPRLKVVVRIGYDDDHANNFMKRDTATAESMTNFKFEKVANAAANKTYILNVSAEDAANAQSAFTASMDSWKQRAELAPEFDAYQSLLKHVGRSQGATAHRTIAH